MNLKPRQSTWRMGQPRYTVGVMVACFSTILIACGGGGSAPASEARQDPAIVAHLSEPAPILFDVPFLIGKSIDEVREALGRPQDRSVEPTELQLAVGIGEWSNVFTRNGQDLLVTFNPRTRKVVDLFLDGTDRATLMRRGNLTEQSHEYQIEVVRALRDPSTITGLKIIPTEPGL
ncbi:MAG: hypothetical protein H0X65_20020 [Gemmatimonadetes bacterium]|nr:hypothetical protein [Gemmatimonadota bacterium]